MDRDKLLAIIENYVTDHNFSVWSYNHTRLMETKDKKLMKEIKKLGITPDEVLFVYRYPITPSIFFCNDFFAYGNARLAYKDIQFCTSLYDQPAPYKNKLLLIGDFNSTLYSLHTEGGKNDSALIIHYVLNKIIEENIISKFHVSVSDYYTKIYNDKNETNEQIILLALVSAITAGSNDDNIKRDYEFMIAINEIKESIPRLSMPDSKKHLLKNIQSFSDSYPKFREPLNKLKQLGYLEAYSMQLDLLEFAFELMDVYEGKYKGEELSTDSALLRDYYQTCEKLYNEIKSGHGFVSSLPRVFDGDDLLNMEFADGLDNVICSRAASFARIKRVFNADYAIKWYELIDKSAHTGTIKDYGRASFLISLIFRDGIGSIKKDLERYEELIRISAGMGYADAINELSIIELQRGNESEARRLRDMAKEMGVDKKKTYTVSYRDKFEEKTGLDLQDSIDNVAGIANSVANIVNAGSSIISAGANAVVNSLTARNAKSDSDLLLKQNEASINSISRQDKLDALKFEQDYAGQKKLNEVAQKRGYRHGKKK